jgi:hypothetical protein
VTALLSIGGSKEADRRISQAFDRALADSAVRREWQALNSIAKGLLTRADVIAALSSFDSAGSVATLLTEISVRGSGPGSGQASPQRTTWRVPSVATSGHRLHLDLRAEGKSTRLERESRGGGGDVGELPSPPVIDVAVVADVSKDALHVHDFLD